MLRIGRTSYAVVLGLTGALAACGGDDGKPEQSGAAGQASAGGTTGDAGTANSSAGEAGASSEGGSNPGEGGAAASGGASPETGGRGGSGGSGGSGGNTAGGAGGNSAGPAGTGGLAAGGTGGRGATAGGTTTTAGSGNGGATEAGTTGSGGTGEAGATGTGATDSCGNGILDALYLHELCDDGNRLDGDGCDGDCTPSANPYTLQQTLRYKGSQGSSDDNFGAVISADRDWLVVAAYPGQAVIGATIPETADLSVYRFNPSATSGPQYELVDILVDEDLRGGIAEQPKYVDPQVFVSDDQIAWSYFARYYDAKLVSHRGIGLFEWDGAAWNDKFGIESANDAAISLNHGRLAVSDGPATGVGLVTIYRVDEAELRVEQTLSDYTVERFGTDVDLKDDVAAVSSAEGIHLYRRTGELLAFEQLLPCQGGYTALGPDLLVTTSDCGISQMPSSPYTTLNVFRHHADGWIHEQTTYAPTSGFFPFGSSISVAADHFVVGGGYGQSEAGVAHVFRYDSTRGWLGYEMARGVKRVVDDNNRIDSYASSYGFSVATVGNAVIVGAPREPRQNRALTAPQLGGALVYWDCPTDAACPLRVCDAGAATCFGNKAGTCDAAGLGPSGEPVDCAATSDICVDGACVAPACEAGSARCVGSRFERCANEQTGYRTEDTCSSEESCTADPHDARGPGCHALVCEPGATACDGERLGTCRSDGSGLDGTPTDCRASDDVCVAGACVNPLFYDGFENGFDTDHWATEAAAPSVISATGADGTASSLNLGGPARRTLLNYVVPSYLGVWVFGGCSVGFRAPDVSEYGDPVLFATVRPGTSSVEVPGYQSPASRTQTWDHFEFRNISWTARTSDFYWNGDLMVSGLPLNAGSAVSAVTLNVGGTCLVDEIVIK